MTWIRTISLSEGGAALQHAVEAQIGLYPVEYNRPVHPTADGMSGIVGSHSLLPKVLEHAFSTFGALMDPALPLARRQHEMIAATVSSLNRCFY